MGILVGMSQITKHVNRCEATVKDWIDMKSFPAYKIDGIWEADSQDIDEWRKNRLQDAKNTPYERSGKFSCPYCGRLLGSKAALATHSRTCKAGKNVDIEAAVKNFT